jgi:hypothetical protein
MQELKLNYRNYSEHEVNMRNFVQSTGHNSNMYANIKYDNMHIFL